MIELAVVIFFIWGVRQAVADSRAAWARSRKTYMDRADARYPDMPQGKRTRHAIRHDLGYALAQATRGFPEARHGFADGWNEGKQAAAAAKAERVKAKPGYASREPAKWKLQASPGRGGWRKWVADDSPDDTSGTCLYCLAPAGTPHNPGCAIGAGHRKQQEKGNENPGDDTPASPQELPDSPAPCKTCGNPVPGDGTCAAACPKTSETTQTPQPTTPNTEGTNVSHTASGGTAHAQTGETSYTQQVTELTAIRRDAEDEVSSISRKRILSRLDVLTSLGLDQATLSDAMAIDEALREQQKAAQATFEAADTALNGLVRRHGGIKQAVDDAPIPAPAEKPFYVDA